MSQIIDLGKLRFSFAGDYNNATVYELNDIVKYGGNVYVYTYAVKASGQLPTNTSYWSLMVEGIKFKGVYSNTTAYKVGDGVAHGGKVYIAVIDTNGNTPPNVTYWSQFADGIQYEGTYVNATQYQRNDVVSYGSSGYIALQDTSGNLPTNTTFWAKLIEGVSASGAWSSTTAYVPNDLVAYGANQYKAIANNTNQVPTNAAGVLNSNWILLTESIRARGDWATLTEYYTNDVVQRGGTSYICLARNASTVFETDLAANKWAKFNGGVRWRGLWTAQTSYLKDDIVRDALGSAYIATQDHAASGSFVTDAAKWTLFAVGGGDVLPIYDQTDIGGSLTLKSDGVTLDWIGATASDKVFYVAPHGSNGTSMGRNIATPFSSIKYACSVAPAGSTIFVKTGTYSEQLPITVPANVAIVGDNQRTTIVEPAPGLSIDGVTPNNQQTMWLLSNGSILNKMTFIGMTGWVPGTTPENVTTSTIKGVVAAFNPASPITTKSPYVLECSAIGSGCIGALIDGSVHATGAKTMIFHGYTIISDNGIGYWVKDGGKSEIVSCFTYYCYFGYTASGGGFIRALNGNNSYGTWGATARGFASSETPVTGTVLGRQLAFTYGAGAFNVGDTITGKTGTTPLATYSITVAQTSGVNVYYVNGVSKPTLALQRGGVYTFDLSDASLANHPIAFKDGAGTAYTTGVVNNGTPGQAGATTVITVASNAPNDLRYYCTVHGDAMGNTITVSGTAPTVTGTAVITNVQYSANKIYVKDITGTFAAGNTLTTSSGGTGAVNSGAMSDQSGFVLVLNNLTALPKPGASISLAGDAFSYVVQTSSGTYVNAASEIVIVLAQDKPNGSAPGTIATVRYVYSQIRLTGHDFLSIGTGGTLTTNYPNTPTQTAAPGNETDEAFPGRVYYVSTDQDGNFRVGEYFRIDQATGKATLNASAFDLSGLSSLKLGSIGAQLGETINEFSSDITMSGNSNFALPTEFAVKGYVDNTAVAKAGGTMTGLLTLSGAPTSNLHAATKLYADNAASAKQDVLVSGTNIKTINATSILGSGDIVISGGGLASVARGGFTLASYFPDISWNNTNTNTYGWIIQRTYNVASGVAQFALVQGGYRSTSQGGNSGTVFPFQIAADNSFVAGTPVRMWSNSSSPSDFSTCSLITDNKSGGFHYSGNICWPGTSSHTMGWGTGLLNADNTAGTFTNSGTTTTQGIHDHNGNYFGLPDGDGWGWYGCNNGYSQSDSTTRIHQINYSNPNSPSIDVQNPSANTSTSPVMQFILQDNNTTANTAISGSCHYRNGSSQIVARVFGAAGSYNDYNSGQNWSEAYASSQYYGFALADGRVLVYHGPGNSYVYTGSGSRSQVSASSPFSNPDWLGRCFINDGTNSWLVLTGASSSFPGMQKWTINPSTYTWTQNWETENPIATGTSSYLGLNKMPNNRIFLSWRDSEGRFKYWIFNRSQFPA